MDYSFLEKIVSDGVNCALLDAIKTRAEQADILALLDAEVQRSTARLQRLRKYRNSLSSPMYRLHPEILSHIFFIYAQDMDGLVDLRWTKLLLVCRRWHDVGISTPRLWSSITVTSHRTGANVYGYKVSEDQDACDVRRIEVQRARTGRYPMTLELHFVHQIPRAKEAYLLMFWHPSSLYSLSIHGQRKHVVKILDALSARQHPNLQLLAVLYIEPIRVDLTATEANAVAVEERSLIKLMSGMLKEIVPRLQSLRISELPFDWTSAQRLRALKASYLQEMRFPFCLDDVLDALGRSPLVKEVNLVLPRTFSPNVASPRQKVTLSRINLLSLTAAAAVSTQILQLLALPPSIGLRVSAPGSSPPDALSVLAACLGRYACQPGAPAIRSVSLIFTSTAAPVEVGGFHR